MPSSLLWDEEDNSVLSRSICEVAGSFSVGVEHCKHFPWGFLSNSDSCWLSPSELLDGFSCLFQSEEWANGLRCLPFALDCRCGDVQRKA
jgi:hypothetical protein